MKRAAVIALVLVADIAWVSAALLVDAARCLDARATRWSVAS